MNGVIPGFRVLSASVCQFGYFISTLLPIRQLYHPSLLPSRNRWLFRSSISTWAFCVVCCVPYSTVLRRRSLDDDDSHFSINSPHPPSSSALPETPTRFCASRLIVPNLYGQFSRRSLPMFASPFTRFLFNLMDGFRCNFLPQTLDLHPLPPLHER